MNLVNLTPPGVAWCIQEGTRTQAGFSGRPGHYRTNNSSLNHIIAKLGESAVETWLKAAMPALALDSVFRDIKRMSECDLSIPAVPLRIEIKCWNAHTWDRGGRCVSPSQAPKIATKADVVVWCRLSERVSEASLQRGSGVAVGIMGWSTPAEIRARTPANTSFDETERLNHQVPIEAMRLPAALLARLAST